MLDVYVPSKFLNYWLFNLLEWCCSTVAILCGYSDMNTGLSEVKFGNVAYNNLGHRCYLIQSESLSLLIQPTTFYNCQVHITLCSITITYQCCDTGHMFVGLQCVCVCIEANKIVAHLRLNLISIRRPKCSDLVALWSFA